MFENFFSLVSSVANHLVGAGALPKVLQALPFKPKKITASGAIKFDVLTEEGAVVSVGESIQGNVTSDGKLDIAPSVPSVFFNGRPITLADVPTLALQGLSSVASSVLGGIVRREMPAVREVPAVRSLGVQRDPSVVRVAAGQEPNAPQAAPGPRVTPDQLRAQLAAADAANAPAEPSAEESKREMPAAREKPAKRSKGGRRRQSGGRKPA